MREALRQVLALSLSGSVLIFALIGLRPLVKHKLSRAWQYYLWVIVLLRLTIPLTPALGHVGGLLPPEQLPSVQVSDGTDNPVWVTAKLAAVAVTEPTQTAVTPPPAAADKESAPGASRTTIHVDLTAAAGIVWLAGAAFIFLFKAARYAHFTRQLRNSARPLSEVRIQRLFAETAASMRLRNRPALRVSGQVSSPMLVGLINPAVLLPESALSEENVSLPFVLRHELTHFKRRDILYKWFVEFALCVHWFNPLAYLMARYIAEACELSCDEAVASRLDADDRQLYGRALLDAAAERGFRGRRLLSTALRGDKSNMKERLKTILEASKKTKAAAAVSATLALTLLFGGVLLGACSAGSASPPSTPGTSPAQTGTASSEAPPSGTDAMATSPDSSGSSSADENAVWTLTENFGKVLKNVSLLAPSDQLTKSMDENYAQYVTPELLAAWKADPSTAPGRYTSSPWPDRIGVLAVEKKSDGVYIVSGDIIDVTSTEVKNGGAADTRPFTANVVLTGGRWLISSWSDIKSGDTLVYSNTDYGFDFRLPSYWKGYTVVAETWEGTQLSDSTKVSGPELLLRNPQWTSAAPTLDIPILVLSLAQWDNVQQEKLVVSAAPVPPTELGRNASYVFALAPRYAFYDYPGRADVMAIISGNPLSPTQNIGKLPEDAPASASASPQDGIVYDNTTYGFKFDLPKDWAGYTIVTEEWQGRSLSDSGTVIAKGPELLIRNPKWTSQNPTQDIPIMVFTLSQWDDLQKENFAVSAAPIPPSELGRNSKYVFALPPRYNFAFPTGYEEVEDIMNGKPLHAYDK